MLPQGLKGTNYPWWKENMCENGCIGSFKRNTLSLSLFSPSLVHLMEIAIYKFNVVYIKIPLRTTVRRLLSTVKKINWSRNSIRNGSDCRIGIEVKV